MLVIFAGCTSSTQGAPQVHRVQFMGHKSILALVEVLGVLRQKVASVR